MVVSGRIELPTHGSSDHCSTDWATRPWRFLRESNPQPLRDREVCYHYTKEPWLRELDLNQRPSDYEPDELPNCSIPRCVTHYYHIITMCKIISFIKLLMADAEGFEPPLTVKPLSVFKTEPFSHLGKHPQILDSTYLAIILAIYWIVNIKYYTKKF